MKKIFLICCLLAGLHVQMFAQEEKVYERRGSGIYFELLGNAIGYSINYESRFSDSNRGLGVRIGISGLPTDEKASLILPVMLNYLVGKPEAKHFLDLGAGITYLSRSGVSLNSDDKEIFFESNTYATFAVMYHYHPPFGGFLFKFGFTPFIGSFDGQDSNVLVSLGLCLGYAF